MEVVTHSKAANLNHGFTFVEKLGTGPSEYVAVLDVDMIPSPKLLRALLPHLLDDPSFAMTTAPQNFYNLPDGDPLSQSMTVLFDLIWLQQDTSDSSMCAGTGFVVRRSAVENIGGIPTDYLNEDVMSSLLLCAKGWKIAYRWEPLQWGLAPDSYAGHVKQGRRWAKGLTAIILDLLRRSRLSKISFGGRVQAALDLVAFIDPVVALTFAMLFLPAILISGKPVVTPETLQQLRDLVALSAFQLLVVWINGLLQAECMGFRAPIWPPYRHSFLAPFQSIALIELCLPVVRNFSPSGSMLDGQSEREAQASNSLIRRLTILLRDPGSWFQLLVITSSIFGATLCFWSTLSAQETDVSFQHRVQRLLVGAAWPPAFVHWTMLIVECWKPISYVIFPRKAPAREDLLNRDPKTRVAYPSDTAKDQNRVRPSQRFALAILVYAILILACCWGMKFE